MSNPSIERRLQRIVLNRKSSGEATKQQRGALMFYVQDELNKGKVITMLKKNLSGPYNKEGNPYDHRATGFLEKSIMPAADGPRVFTKRFLTVALTGDRYLGLGISLDEFSAKIEAASYAQKLSDGFSSSGVTQDEIARWVYAKARKNPNSRWTASYKRKDGYRSFDYYGNKVTASIAMYIAKPITKKLQVNGYAGSGWMEFLQGPAGLKGALTRAYGKYLNDYPAYTWATMTNKINKMLEKLEK
jgi:hypothetical protein